MKNLTKENLQKTIKESAKSNEVVLKEINIEESESNFYVDLTDINSRIVRDYIFKSSVVSQNNLDDQINTIIEKF